MKRIVATLFTVALLLPTSIGMAQDGEDVETRFYDFNEMLIDGELMRPEGLFTRARDRARFNRLLDLRRDFIEEIDSSAEEPHHK